MKISVEDRTQDLLERFSVGAAVQDPCGKLSKNDLRARPLLSSPGLRTRSPSEVSWQDPGQNIYKGSLRKISWQDLCKRPLGKISATDLHAINVSVQDLQKRCPGKIAVQDLYQRSLGKISVQNSTRGLLARPLQEISIRDLFRVEAAVQDPCVSLSVQGVFKRSPQKISVRDLKVRSLVKLSRQYL